MWYDSGDNIKSDILEGNYEITITEHYPYSTGVRVFITNKMQCGVPMSNVEGIVELEEAERFSLESFLEIMDAMGIIKNQSHMKTPSHGPNGINYTYHYSYSK